MVKKSEENDNDKKVVRKKKINNEKNIKRTTIRKEKTITESFKDENNDSHIAKTNSFSNLEVYVIMIVCLALGLAIGIFISGYKIKGREVFEDDKELVDIYNDIKKNSYRGIGNNFNKEQTKAMIAGLDDPHAVYYEGYAAARYKEELENAFIGIGTEVKFEENGDIVFINIFKDSPAEKSGIRLNDKLIKVEDESVIGKNLDESVNLIRGGSDGDKVKLTLLRGEEEVEVILTKEVIMVDTVSLDYTDGHVAILKIKYFSKTTYDEVKAKLEEAKKEKIDKVIVDLRDNNKGYMNVASDIASLFLDKDTVIYKEETNNGITEIKSKAEKKYNFDLVLLTNLYTSKCAEMLVSSLKENIGVMVIGGNTAGDSSIQTSRELESGDVIEFTTGRWLTPNGLDVSQNIIIPDYEINADEDIYAKAIEVINGNNM